ncbi:hypothetical protein M427DRAFT_29720 [Gonapodya prolifera JEL478]|uniref:SH3 domain-containing protein n=1 Tax=Gonapodya prolifera (strain JEL478) TaxID=1344416 RepID=A0A139ANR7_GONPJ|nr:hypothetical protein M427DRAFT_29720 [Gonapodya prolifera JEL478]|eukprot:KXS18390.1 hypothetical protein M427DRAFT_29720 [Gonapodya prolifera JEL478]
MRSRGSIFRPIALPLPLLLLFYDALPVDSQTVTSTISTATATLPPTSVLPLAIFSAPVGSPPPTFVSSPLSSSSGPDLTVIVASVGSVLAALLIIIGGVMMHKRRVAKRLRLAAEARGQHGNPEYVYDSEVWEDDYRVDPHFWQPVVPGVGPSPPQPSPYARLIGVSLANNLPAYTFPDAALPELEVEDAFFPTEPNEIRLSTGDRVRLESCTREGLAVGQNLATGEFGVFPLSNLRITSPVVPAVPLQTPSLPHSSPEPSLPSPPSSPELSSSPNRSKVWSRLLVARWGKKTVEANTNESAV